MPHKVQLDFDEIPIIDYSLSESDSKKYFEQLRYAYEDVGFLILKNVPGFEDSFQQSLWNHCERLFNMPQEWKDAHGTEKWPSLRGYFRSDDVEGPHKAHAEAYRIGPELPAPGNGTLDDPSVPFWMKLHEGPNQWPTEEDMPGFRAGFETLYDRYYHLNVALNKQICELLEIPYETLTQYFHPEKVEFSSGIRKYHPISEDIRTSAKNGFANGMHAHRDSSTFVTTLIQNRPGLQVQNHKGDWLDVPMVDGGVIVNIGMKLMQLTGGHLVATNHRVNTLNIDADRYTVPYVLTPRLDAVIKPLPQFARPEAAKEHAPPNPQMLKLMAIEDPCVRSGYARITLFPAATSKLYPKEFQEAVDMGIIA